MGEKEIVLFLDGPRRLGDGWRELVIPPAVVKLIPFANLLGGTRMCDHAAHLDGNGGPLARAILFDQR